jgi:hypothetical protein
MHRADKYITKSASRNQADSKHIQSAISAGYCPIMSASFQQRSRYLPRLAGLSPGFTYPLLGLAGLSAGLLQTIQHDAAVSDRHDGIVMISTSNDCI